MVKVPTVTPTTVIDSLTNGDWFKSGKAKFSAESAVYSREEDELDVDLSGFQFSEISSSGERLISTLSAYVLSVAFGITFQYMVFC